MKHMYETLCLLVIAVVLTGCNQPKEQQQVKQQSNEMPPQSPHQTLQQGPISAVAGIQWTAPQRWKEQPPRQMRITTYTIPEADGDAEGGECAVFYFGSGQGGDISGNIGRWASQFENSPKPEQSSKQVNGLTITMVNIAGNYLAPSGPMMQSQGKKEHYRLLGAIVAAPEGSVFFKFTGPAKTIGTAEEEFNALVNSLEKSSKM